MPISLCSAVPMHLIPRIIPSHFIIFFISYSPLPPIAAAPHCCARCRNTSYPLNQVYMFVLPMNHPAHSSSSLFILCCCLSSFRFPLALHSLCHVHIPSIPSTSAIALYSKLFPLTFVGTYLTQQFCRGIVYLIHISICVLPASIFLTFSWSWFAFADGIYLLVYAARGASHQSRSK
ncbi:hypothetical protein M405DRAFT_229049 [Rhizopogon salebrosus TDB-379]|nr:hypothetical protein M405DRAFT_229049 [Rhizopogon salebrosus TDB-379]